jgi:hypothetical protein
MLAFSPARAQEAEAPKAEVEDVLELTVEPQEFEVRPLDIEFTAEPKDVLKLNVEGKAELDVRPLDVEFTLQGEDDKRAALIEKVNQSKYWLGIACEPAGDALKAQLKLDHGLVVQSVMEKSPAAESGSLRLHDVLVKVNDTPLKSVEDLVLVVDKAEGKQVMLTLVRDGKEASLQLTPAERPNQAWRAAIAAQTGLDKAWIRNDLADFELKVIRPAVAVPANRVEAIKLPDDVTISIRKEGNNPAKIDVKRGDKSWSVTEDKVGELPEDVRDMVERVRGGRLTIKAGDGVRQTQRLDIIRAVPSIDWKIAKPSIEVQATPKVRSIELAPPKATRVVTAKPSSSVEAKLDDVLRKLDQILKNRSEAAPASKLEQEVERLRRDLDALEREIGRQKR